jgi:hypothetical protein
VKVPVELENIVDGSVAWSERPIHIRFLAKPVSHNTTALLEVKPNHSSVSRTPNPSIAARDTPWAFLEVPRSNPLERIGSVVVLVR